MMVPQPRTLPLTLLTLLTLLTCGTLVAQDPPRSIDVFDLTFLDEAETNQTSPRPPELRDSYRNWYGSVGLVLEADRRTTLKPTDVLNAVKTFIAPDSWNNSRNEIDFEEDRLWVVQRPEILERIASFVRGLETQMSTKLRVEVALVPRNALETAVPGWRQSDSAHHLDGATIRRAVSLAGDRGHLATAVAPPGSPVRIRPQVSSRELAGYEIAQSGVIPVSSPAVRNLAEGLDALVTTYRVPGLDGYRVDVQLSETVIVGERTKRRVMYGEIEERNARQRYLSTSVIAREGRTVVLGSFEPPPGGDGQWPGEWVTLLRITECPGLDAGEADTGPQLLDIGFLATPSPRFPRRARRDDGTLRFTGGEVDDRPSETADLRRLRTLLGDDEEGDSWLISGNTLFVERSSAVATLARVAIDELVPRRVDLLEVQLWQGTTTLEELGGGIVLGSEWIPRLDTEPGLRTRVTGRPGIVLRLVSLLQKPLIRDVELVSGASEDSDPVQVADPVEGYTSSGVDIEVRIDRIPETSRVEFRVGASIARPSPLERHADARVGFGVEVIPDEDESATNDDRAAARFAAGWQTLDLPDEDRDELQHQVTVSPGDPVLLNIFPSTESGRVRALIAVIRELPWEHE